MNPNFRNFALWVIIILLVVALVMLFQNPGQRVPSQDIAFSQLLNQVDQGHVREVTIAGNEISGHFTDNRAFATYAPNDPTLGQSLYKKNVLITAKPPPESTNWLMTLLVNGLPLIAILGIWNFLSRQMQGAGGKAMGFGKSKAKLLTEAHGRATFEDVAGGRKPRRRRCSRIISWSPKMHLTSFAVQNSDTKCAGLINSGEEV